MRGTRGHAQGDSFFFAFARAKSALATAVIAQRALAEHEWPAGAQLCVRMGLHTGELAVGDERYVGLACTIRQYRCGRPRRADRALQRHP